MFKKPISAGINSPKATNKINLRNFTTNFPILLLLYHISIIIASSVPGRVLPTAVLPQKWQAFLGVPLRSRHPPISIFFNNGEMGFFELGLVDFGGGVHHKVDAGAVFREGNDVSDIVLVFENHKDAI